VVGQSLPVQPSCVIALKAIAISPRWHGARWPLVLNVVLFQAAWFGCVIAAAHGAVFWGVAAVALAAGIHLALSVRPKLELQLLLVTAFIGLLWDSLVLDTGWIGYSSGLFSRWLAPTWIVAMWVLFATTLNVSLRWLRGRPALSALFGLVGGPLAFYGGARLGAVHLLSPALGLAMQGAGWAVLTPALVRIARRFDV
jgi:hypothetical protein